MSASGFNGLIGARTKALEELSNALEDKEVSLAMFNANGHIEAWVKDFTVSGHKGMFRLKVVIERIDEETGEPLPIIQ